MRQATILVRLVLAGAVLVLVLAPLTQAMDRGDHFTPRDTELNLCALAMLGTAGFWAVRHLAAGRTVRTRSRRAAAAPAGRLVSRVRPQPDAEASPPGLGPPLLRI